MRGRKNEREAIGNQESMAALRERLCADAVSVALGVHAQEQAGQPAARGENPPDPDWKAWPGGRTAQVLNPQETFSSTDFGFSGNIDWDVGQGKIAGKIIETDGTTATGRATITVRYDTRSATSAKTHTVQIRATKDGVTKTQTRTVFTGTWSINSTTTLANENNLRFDPAWGTSTNKCAFNWPDEDGARFVAGKIEAKLKFEPTGIQWTDRGVTFTYSNTPDPPQKYMFRVQRKGIRTQMYQTKQAKSQRNYGYYNDLSWEYDDEATAATTQYPTKPNTNSPDWAFRMDAPNFDPNSSCRTQCGLTSVKWANGTTVLGGAT